jgi:anthranilate synthase/aminodeoxychorismate synthase-like glutamine amidotransferase
MLLIIDNFDSFTYNLVQYIEQLGATTLVCRNNAITTDEIKSLSPKGIVISPGPGTPNKAGVSLDIIATFSGQIPILGVCLGHQAIAQHFGAKVTLASTPVHGKTSLVYHNQKGLFKSIASPFRATRYHSLVVEREGLPACLEITAETESGIIMGFQHTTHALWGVQFHPESYATESGLAILDNFLHLS